MTAPKKLRGRVVRVTLRPLKSGAISHDTRIEFYPDEDGHPFGSVRIQGRLANDAVPWDTELLAALRTRYAVGSLPLPRWTGSYVAGSVSVVEDDQ